VKPSGDLAHDRPARVLEWGLALLVFAAPLPFGAVGPLGRTLLEGAAAGLLLLLAARALRRPTPLPPRSVLAGALGMLALAAFQALPLGDAVVGVVSPRSVRIRAESQPPAPAAAAEARLLGREPGSFDRPASVSLDPGATASALRTGCALLALLLVGTAVAALRGARTLALALLLSAAFQGLYGLLVVASSHDRIWHLPKKYFLDNATGTFVNRNHFACLLAMSLAPGAALLLAVVRRRGEAARRRVVALLGREGGPGIALGLLLVVGLAGLLLSYSRAGIALGLLALVLTLLVAGRAHRPRARVLLVALVVAAALVPLAQIGADRLLRRYLESTEVTDPGARTTVWADTLALAADFPLAGCGFGSFAATYPLYRSAEVRKFYAHAHNDPLQALAEGGALGFVLLALALAPVLAALPRALSGGKGTLGVGVAAGLAAWLLNSLVDFNAHIPSNAATAAVLDGAILGLPWKRPA
jgi:O-antigen ligase